MLLRDACVIFALSYYALAFDTEELHILDPSAAFRFQHCIFGGLGGLSRTKGWRSLRGADTGRKAGLSTGHGLIFGYILIFRVFFCLTGLPGLTSLTLHAALRSCCLWHKHLAQTASESFFGCRMRAVVSVRIAHSPIDFYRFRHLPTGTFYCH